MPVKGLYRGQKGFRVRRNLFPRHSEVHQGLELVFRQALNDFYFACIVWLDGHLLLVVEGRLLFLRAFLLTTVHLFEQFSQLIRVHHIHRLRFRSFRDRGRYRVTVPDGVSDGLRHGPLTDFTGKDFLDRVKIVFFRYPAFG